MLRHLLLLLSVLVCLQVSLSLPAATDMEDMPDGLELSKRAYRPVPFPCNGYDYQPRCLHGGKGPRKTWTKSGRFCICFCPTKWIGPECSFAAETMEKFLL